MLILVVTFEGGGFEVLVNSKVVNNGDSMIDISSLHSIKELSKVVDSKVQ